LLNPCIQKDCLVAGALQAHGFSSAQVETTLLSIPPKRSVALRRFFSLERIWGIKLYTWAGSGLMKRRQGLKSAGGGIACGVMSIKQ